MIHEESLCEIVNGTGSILMSFPIAGKPHIRLNRKSIPLLSNPHHISLGHIIESGGHMVLGQYSPDADNRYELSVAYIG